MKLIKYFLQFIIISILFFIFKILGLRLSSWLSSKIVFFFGPLFRSKKLINSNILRAMPHLNQKEIKNIVSNMWKNYGRILSEYIFIKDFKRSIFKSNFNIEGQDILDQIKKDDKPVIFISGHFNNFELMAMHIDKSGINLAAVYRPLNNIFLLKTLKDRFLNLILI